MTLARNYATENRDLEYFETIALISLERLYPNAPATLRKQLCDTMTDRYAKLVYNAHCRSTCQADGQQDAKAASLKKEKLQEPELTYSEKDDGDTDTVQKVHSLSKFEKMALKDQQSGPTSSFDTRRLYEVLSDQYKPDVSQSRSSVSVYQIDNQLHEPQPPRFENGETHISCAWCQEIIDQSFVTEKGWSNKGR